MPQQSIQIVPIDSIKCLPQIREQPDCDSVGGLATTIRELGIQQPLLVRRVEGQLVLTDGARRLAAARLAGLTMVPVLIEPDHLTDVQVIQRQLVANLQRKSLKPMEKAMALDDVMKRATWSAAQAAAHLGLSNAAVTRLLSLLTLPEGIRDKVASGEISPSVAYELSRIVDSERQIELAD